MRILLVEDEPQVSQLVEDDLSERGYEVVVSDRGAEAIRIASSETFDVIVLDLMMPGIGGLEVASRLRTGGCRTPILMLTALGSEADVVRGLDIGADDYLRKPFGLDELDARIRSLGRRFRDSGGSLTAGDIEMDRIGRTVRRGTVGLHLTDVEFRLLETLMIAAGETVSRKQLLERVWGMDFDPATNLITTHMSNLRTKLEAGGQSRIIHTVRGEGYRLESARH